MELAALPRRVDGICFAEVFVVTLRSRNGFCNFVELTQKTPVLKVRNDFREL